MTYGILTLKTFILILLVFVCTYFTAFLCLAQDIKAGGRGQKTTSLPTEPAKQGKDGSSEKQAPLTTIRVRTMQKVDFSGTVTFVDAEGAVISIQSKGKTIGFDMSRPVLIGYHSTKEIRKGDAVSVGYTQAGLQIRKGTFPISAREPKSRAERSSRTGRTSSKPDATKPQKGSLVRVRDKAQPTSFQDVDNNKDGKVTPIELCVMYPDLTMEKFKEYDKNGDGCLSEAEFRAIRRTRP